MKTDESLSLRHRAYVAVVFLSVLGGALGIVGVLFDWHPGKWIGTGSAILLGVCLYFGDELAGSKPNPPRMQKNADGTEQQK